MWSEGTIGIPDAKDKGKYTVCHYWVKHYEKESQFGIDNGRISKLILKQDGKLVYNYDRGEDIEPQTPEAEKALAILIYQFN